MSYEYYKWIAEVCKELNWETEEGAYIVDDVNWFGCFDDGMSAKDAVDEAVSKGAVVRRSKNEKFVNGVN